MAGKVSLKTAIIIFFYFGIVLILSACMVPIDIDVFLAEEEHVQKLIETTKLIVYIDDKTGDGLKGEKGKITGLKDDRYYMIEKQIDDKGVVNPTPPYPKFVTDYQGIGPGGLISDLGVITRISGKSINNLIDRHTYTVRAAEPFKDGTLSYTDGKVTAAVKQITGGTVNIEEMDGNGSLNLSTVVSGKYEVIAVSVGASKNNSWNYTSKTISDWKSFALEEQGTETDYVFVSEKTPLDFKVLKVIIGTIDIISIPAIDGVTQPAAGAVPATDITPTAEYTGTIAWTPAVSGAFAPNTSYTATITLSPKTGYTLTGVAADFFTVADTSTPATNAANSGVITAVFPATDKTIDILTIQGVTKPVTGETPVNTITETAQYTGTIAWTPAVSGTFAGGQAYTATITLTSKPGFTVYGLKENAFTVADTSAPAANAANTGVITAVFPVTDKAKGNLTITFTISDAKITGNVTSISYNDIAKGNSSLVFTLTGGITGVTWKLGETTASGGSDTSLTINNTSNLLTLLVPGTHSLDVIGTEDGLKYSAYIEFTVSDN